MTEPDESAFPLAVGENNLHAWGMSIREAFAAMALQGLLSNNEVVQPKEMAKDAVAYADALIDALNTPPIQGDA